MQPDERARVLEHLRANREKLHGCISGLNPHQWAFRSVAEGWSAAECLEHIVVVEQRVLKSIQHALDTPPEPEKCAALREKDRTVFAVGVNREVKFKGPNAVMPSARWPLVEELVSEFDRTRDATLQFAEETEADLRSHAFPHPFFQDLDCYQWLLLLGRHCERHVLQMEEVKADPAFPAA